MKINKKNVVAGALGVTIVTLGAVSAVSAAPNMQNQFDGERGQSHRGGSHLQVAADVIGVSVEDLQERLQGGENMPDILESEGVTRDELRAARSTMVEERIAKAVESGKITQEEADERKEKKEERQAGHEARKVAVENNDYEAFAETTAGSKIADKINEANFSKLVAAHELRADGDHEAAKEIMKELGLKGQGHKMHKGGQRGTQR